ncbi:MAG: FAD:protein FMN transferase [Acidimicrobiia bacterium]
MDSFVDRFAAMGTQVEIMVVDSEPVLLARARDRVAELEHRWSRFLPDSEVSRLNAAEGETLTVSSATILLLTRAAEGYELTRGRFDPYQLDALERVGYRTTFAEVGRPMVEAPAPDVPDASGRVRLPVVDVDSGRVSLPRGLRFDPGGIGKGLAADLVAAELRAAGAAGVCVNIGGDVRVAGTSPDEGGWVVAIRDRESDAPVARLAVSEGGIATTSRSRRQWEAADGIRYHHVIDPATGTSAPTPVVFATAVASEAWQAEVLSKVAFLDRNAGIEFAESLGATAMVATADSVITGRGWSRYERTMQDAR